MSTIVAVSTPHGTGGIAVIRISGPDALNIANRAWRGTDLAKVKSHTAHLGNILAFDGSILDNVVATVFIGPRSYTGEDTVEFSIHGSAWLQHQVINRLIELGASPAQPGEFTKRAFINGRLDLAQAEGVADVIAASSRAAHKLAMSQLSGSFSAKLNLLRESLVELASLLELELDFSEEEVEFADRKKLRSIAEETLALMQRLASTYKSGRAFKEGVPVAIAGQPNAGKSTLLNSLLDDDKAIVSDIPGTTRDVIEDAVEIEGVLFRFFDTAGLRETNDQVEKIGISRAYEAISKAYIILWIIDSSEELKEIEKQIKNIEEQIDEYPDSCHIILYNKIDNSHKEKKSLPVLEDYQSMSISAKTGFGLEDLKQKLVSVTKAMHDPESELIVTNARHHQALLEGSVSLKRAVQALEQGLSADFVAQDIRETIHHLSLLTGQISTDTLLGNIFANFCIGK